MIEFPDLGGGALAPLVPFLILTVGGLVLVLIDALIRGGSFPWHIVSTALPVAAIITYAVRWPSGVGSTPFGPMFLEDTFGAAVGVLVCIAAIFGLLMSGPFLEKAGRTRGEYYSLIIFSAAGMILFTSTTELLSLFLGLELLSIPLYILSGYLRKDTKSLEAGMKYFLLGAFSSAVFLFGGAFIYVATGTTDLAVALSRGADSAMVQAGFLILFSGFLFKAATVPFHMWAPDVYHGAPTAVTAFMTTAVKAAAFGAMGRIVMTAFPLGAELPLTRILWWIAVLTMTVGNLAALTQTNIKRMLAYSSIAHAGYLMIGLTVYADSGDTQALAGMLYYLLAYTLMNIGAFAVVINWAQQGKEHLEIPDYAGLGWRTPGLGLAMSVFMISLAGIPPTAGFFGKYYLFVSAVDHGFNSLVVIAVLNSALSVYYYLRVMVALYMRKPMHELVLGRSMLVGAVVLVCALGTFWVGFAPDSFLPGVPSIVCWFQGSVLALR